MLRLLFIIVFMFSVSACSKKSHSIYANIPEDSDGIVDSQIPFDGTEEASGDQPALILSDELTKAETDIAKKYNKSQFSRFSFLIVDANSQQVMRSYKAFQPRRLASVTKISTAITALENVTDVSVDKVKEMLKSSNNGEASRYLRLSVKSLNDYIVPGSAYALAHSCPSSLSAEYKAASMMLDWVKSQITSVDWTGGALKDGAGCDYGNTLNALQLIKILQYADSKGAAYAGQSFEKLLSISGVDGTWASHNTEHKGMVLAKTGTLNLNSNLAGYFYAKRNGKMNKYYFTVLVEKDSGTSNTTLARTFIENLVRQWINYYSLQAGEPLAQL